MKKLILFLFGLLWLLSFSFAYEVENWKTYNVSSHFSSHIIFGGKNNYEVYINHNKVYGNILTYCKYSSSVDCKEFKYENGCGTSSIDYIPFVVSTTGNDFGGVFFFYKCGNGDGRKFGVLSDLGLYYKTFYSVSWSWSDTYIALSGGKLYFIAKNNINTQYAYTYDLFSGFVYAGDVDFQNPILFEGSDNILYFNISDVFLKKKSSIIKFDTGYITSSNISYDVNSFDLYFTGLSYYFSDYLNSYKFSENHFYKKVGFLYDYNKLVKSSGLLNYSGFNYHNNGYYGSYVSGGILYIDVFSFGEDELSEFDLNISSNDSNNFTGNIYFVASGVLDLPGEQYYPYYSGGVLYYKSGDFLNTINGFDPLFDSDNTLWDYYYCYLTGGQFNVICVYNTSYYNRNDYYQVPFPPSWYTLNGSGIVFYSFSGDKTFFAGSVGYSTGGGSIGVIEQTGNYISGNLPSQSVVSFACPVSGGDITNFLNFSVGGWNILGFEIPEYKPLENFACLGNLVIWSLTPGSVFSVGIDFSGNNVIDTSNWGDLNNYSGLGLGDVLLWILMFSIGFKYVFSKSKS